MVLEVTLHAARGEKQCIRTPPLLLNDRVWCAPKELQLGGVGCDACIPGPTHNPYYLVILVC